MDEVQGMWIMASHDGGWWVMAADNFETRVGSVYPVGEEWWVGLWASANPFQELSDEQLTALGHDRILEMFEKARSEPPIAGWARSRDDAVAIFREPRPPLVP